MVMDHPTWYHCCVHDPKKPPHRHLKPTDSFRVIFTAVLRYYLPVDDPNSRPPIIDTKPLFQSTEIIPCNDVFDVNHKDFLRIYLPNSSYASILAYSCPHSIEKISRQIIPQLQRIYGKHASKHASAKSSDSRREPFDCDVNISVDMPVDIVSDDEELLQEEEFLQEDVKMVPASNKVVRSLKTYKLPRQCPICMEKFYVEEEEDDDDEDDVEIMPMPCGHVFHRPCILQWLQTSHMCPLCRCPLSTE